MNVQWSRTDTHEFFFTISTSLYITISRYPEIQIKCICQPLSTVIHMSYKLKNGLKLISPMWSIWPMNQLIKIATITWFIGWWISKQYAQVNLHFRKFQYLRNAKLFSIVRNVSRYITFLLVCFTIRGLWSPFMKWEFIMHGDDKGKWHSSFTNPSVSNFFY